MTGNGDISNDRTPVGTSEVYRPQLVDIRQLRGIDLDPLLGEEIAEWRTTLDWDFSKSADLIRKLAGNGWLNGVALLHGGEIAGYGYTGLEGHSASIWDVYVRRPWRSGHSEHLLLRALFDSLIDSDNVNRIESQLMLIEPSSAEALRTEHRVNLFERILMTLDASTPLPSPSVTACQSFQMDPWTKDAYDAAGRVISLAYTRHVDAAIHEHYRSPAEASRLVYNLIHFPGCAAFHAPASSLAFDRISRQLAGVSVAAFIAADVAHIAELCVVPQFQRKGVGHELLRRSIESLRNAGARRISLSVTALNQPAIRLYNRFGFRKMHRFYAYSWQRSAPRR